jgi:hypothetical protein
MDVKVNKREWTGRELPSFLRAPARAFTTATPW